MINKEKMLEWLFKEYKEWACVGDETMAKTNVIRANTFLTIMNQISEGCFDEDE